MDTGSSWLWVLSDLCKIDCGVFGDGVPIFTQEELDEKKTFHKELSKSLRETNKTKSITYASQETIAGLIVQDTVKANTVDNLEATGFEFMTVMDPSHSLVDSGGISGIIGLAPESDSSGPLFISKLYDNDNIARKQFSMFLTFRPEQASYLTFGGLPDFANDTTDMVCHRISGSFHWQLKLFGIRVGDKEFDSVSAPLMLTDTGTTLTYLPAADFDALLEMICEGHECINAPYSSY